MTRRHGRGRQWAAVTGRGEWNPLSLGRGEVHERAVLERFRAEGLDVVDVSGAEDGAEATREAIRDGAGVVHQGTLAGEAPGAGLFGRPDFLVWTELLPALDGEPRPDGVH